MRSVFSIDALGTLNIWNRKARTNSAKIRAMTAACVYSKKNRRGRAVSAITPSPPSLHLEEGEERLLGDVDAAHLLHALLAFLLLLEELPLARDVAAVALGEHV